jgi:hypothetical protein
MYFGNKNVEYLLGGQIFCDAYEGATVEQSRTRLIIRSALEDVMLIGRRLNQNRWSLTTVAPARPPAVAVSERRVAGSSGGENGSWDTQSDPTRWRVLPRFLASCLSL